jgi:hypothetical protein
MQANKTVTINGRTYDAVTGMPITKSAAKPTAKQKPVATARPVASRPSSTAASSVHSTQQRSQTLHRRAAKKPAVKRPEPGRHMDISRSHQISRFAQHPVTPPQKKENVKDKAPQVHPIARKALAKTTAPAKVAPLSSKQIKEAAISQALAKPTVKQKKEKKAAWWRSRRFLIVTAIFVVLIGGAFLTYISIPGISVSFAASQAGIAATYPEYKPDGYRLNQPVTFSDGEVVLNFASNSSSAGYTITQTRSSWDSSAVLDNVVKKDAGSDYTGTKENGLMIYSYTTGDTTNATWVNGGILYRIESNAPLSGEQIRHIASSL